MTMTEEQWLAEWKESRDKLETKMEQWKDEMVKVVTMYNADIKCIRDIRDENEKKKLTAWYIHKKAIGTGIILFFFLIGLIFFFKNTKVCGELEIPVPFLGQPIKHSSQKGC